MAHLLEVIDLKVKFALRFGDLTAIDGVSFTLDRGERMGLVGESGAGKSVTGFAIINLISKPGYIAEGKVVFAIESARCTECVGDAEAPKCVTVCPVTDCIMPDPYHKETKDQLLAKRQKILDLKAQK